MNPMIIYLNVNCLTLIVSRDYDFATDVYVEAIDTISGTVNSLATTYF